MESINQIRLRGRIGSVRTSDLSEGRKVCSFSVGIDSVYRNQENVIVENTDWFRCSVWSGKKFPNFDGINVGTVVDVTGRVRNVKYTTQDGVDHASWDVTVTDLEFPNPSERLTPICSL